MSETEAAVAQTDSQYQKAEPEATLLVNVELPVSVALALKHRTRGALDVAETLTLIAQLYKDAPLEPQVVVLTRAEHAAICEALGRSPQSVAELVQLIQALCEISFAGVRLRLSADEVALVNARNSLGLEPREFAEQILRQMFEAYRDGRI